MKTRTALSSSSGTVKIAGAGDIDDGTPIGIAALVRFGLDKVRNVDEPFAFEQSRGSRSSTIMAGVLRCVILGVGGWRTARGCQFEAVAIVGPQLAEGRSA